MNIKITFKDGYTDIICAERTQSPFEAVMNYLTNIGLNYQSIARFEPIV